ncbi:MAG: hypothetical protein ACYDIC_09500 [Desulfobaccales bacterium]
MPWFFQVLDPYLIWGYRLLGPALLNFILGTAILVDLSLLLGEVSSFLASRAVRRYMDRIQGEASHLVKLSMDALAAGDRQAYEAANHLANEAFGKTFFLQVAQSGAFFWPAVLALAWMQYRFFEIEFPLPFLGGSLGFIGVFILIYLLSYLGWKRLKKLLFHNDRGRENRHRGPGNLGALREENPVPL